MSQASPGSAPRRAAPREVPAVIRWSVVAAIGLSVGAVTLVMQHHLAPPWSSLVNSASPWVAAVFVIGAISPTLRGAAWAGLVTCMLEVISFYGLAVLEGHSQGDLRPLFWSIFAIAGGPAFAVAGWTWWRGTGWPAALAAAALPAAWVAEGLVFFQLEWHRPGSATLFILIGGAAFLLLAMRGRRYEQAAGGLLLMVPLGIVGEVFVNVALAAAMRIA